MFCAKKVNLIFDKHFNQNISPYDSILLEIPKNTIQNPLAMLIIIENFRYCIKQILDNMSIKKV